MSAVGKFYMTQPVEIEKHARLCARKSEPTCAEGSLETIRAMAGGDLVLLEALWCFWNFEHAFDDLIDESDWSPEMIEAAMAALHDEINVRLGLKTAEAHVSRWTKTFLALIHGCGWDEGRRQLAVQAETIFLTALSQNDIYRTHAAEMRGMFVQCMMRCLDGDAMATGSAEQAAMATAVKCGDLEVMFHMIYLRHGWTRARVVASLRDYDTPETEDK